MACRLKQRGHDARIAGTPAQMSAQDLPYVHLGRPRIALQIVGEGHEDAGGAESALQGVMVLECLLQRIKGGVQRREQFNGTHVAALGLNGERQARAYGSAIDQDRAASANAMLAADVGAGRTERMAEKVTEQHAQLGFR